jgi:hypothetical protein
LAPLVRLGLVEGIDRKLGGRRNGPGGNGRHR